MIDEEQTVWVDKWVSAQRMAKNNPETFAALSLEELSGISVGDNVQICNGYERFWVNIVSIDKKTNQKATAWKFVGKVDNHLVSGSEYNYSDLVGFHGRHIYQINFQADFPKIIEELQKDTPEIIEKFSQGDFEAVNQMLLCQTDKKAN